MKFRWPCEVAVGSERVPVWTAPGKMLVSQAGLSWLVSEEIPDGDEIRAAWPGEQSGITIGIGYDLGQVSLATFRRDWSKLLPIGTARKLEAVVGLQGQAAKRFISQFSDVRISRMDAARVFYDRSLPATVAATLNAYPKAGQLWPGAQEALLSLVYNRGGSLVGDRRREMAKIRDLLADPVLIDLWAIINQLRAMKRLWPKTLGLRDRRDREADRIDAAPFVRYKAAGELLEIG